mgnify:FL=1|tara:strand:- start:351 stop:611 length:261 start_codon:yes stop_codon:yes gene_type:complete
MTKKELKSIIKRLEISEKKSTEHIAWWKKQNQFLQHDLKRLTNRVETLEFKLTTAIEGLQAIQNSHDPMRIAERTLAEIDAKEHNK